MCERDLWLSEWMNACVKHFIVLCALNAELNHFHGVSKYYSLICIETQNHTFRKSFFIYSNLNVNFLITIYHNMYILYPSIRTIVLLFKTFAEFERYFAFTEFHCCHFCTCNGQFTFKIHDYLKKMAWDQSASTHFSNQGWFCMLYMLVSNSLLLWQRMNHQTCPFTCYNVNL